jgi:DNA-directed RNA polymerase specialized sigma24 family protein
MSAPTADALIAIVVSLRWYVLRMIQRRKVPEGERADLVQTVVLLAIVEIRAGRFHHDEPRELRASVRAWVATIAWHAVAGWKHSKRRRGEVGMDGEPPGADPTERLEARDELRVVGYRLNRDERRMLDAIARGVSLTEQAATEGVPLGTVCARIWRVRRALRKRLGR